jgi:hypothetical protein
MNPPGMESLAIPKTELVGPKVVIGCADKSRQGLDHFFNRDLAGRGVGKFDITCTAPFSVSGQLAQPKLACALHHSCARE